MRAPAPSGTLDLVFKAIDVERLADGLGPGWRAAGAVALLADLARVAPEADVLAWAIGHLRDGTLALVAATTDSLVLVPASGDGWDAPWTALDGVSLRRGPELTVLVRRQIMGEVTLVGPAEGLADVAAVAAGRVGTRAAG